MGIVYVTTNRENGKQYVGKTVKTVETRRSNHEKSASAGVDFVFHRALRKYGFDAFEWKVLMECEDEEDLNESEKVCIRLLKARIPDGYNMTDGGDGVPVGPLSGEHKVKISKALKGQRKTAEHLRRISEALMGRKLSPEHVQSLKRAVRPPHTEESNQKRSESQRGKKKHTIESRRKISVAKKGKQSLLKGKTYDEIYGSLADIYRQKRGGKRIVD